METDPVVEWAVSVKDTNRLTICGYGTEGKEQAERISKELSMASFPATIVFRTVAPWTEN